MKTNDCCNGNVIAAMVIAAVLMVASQSALAQDRLSFEFRPGVNFPTNELGDAELNTGFGLEGTFAYRFMPSVAVYAGWSWNRFSSDNSFAGTDIDFEETGYTMGMQYIRPIGESKVNLLLRVGGLYNHIEVENSEGDIIADSGHGLGWQVEGGVAIPLGEKWRLLPSVRYRSLAREITIETVTTSTDLNYVSIGIGIARIF